MRDWDEGDTAARNHGIEEMIMSTAEGWAKYQHALRLDSIDIKKEFNKWFDFYYGGGSRG